MHRAFGCFTVFALVGAALFAGPAAAQIFDFDGPHTYTFADDAYAGADTVVRLGFNTPIDATTTGEVVTGGMVERLEAYHAAHVFVHGGAAHYLSASGHSTFEIRYGAVGGLIVSEEASGVLTEGAIVQVAELSQTGHTVVIQEGANVGALNLHGASVSMGGGTVGPVTADNHSYFVTEGGTVESVHVADNGVATLGGAIVGPVTIADTAFGEINFGHAADVTVQNHAHFNVNGGEIHSLSTYNIATGDIFGGHTGFAGAHDDSVINIYDGAIDDIMAYDSGVINVFGGTIGPSTIRLSDFATLNFTGSGFSLTSGNVGVDALTGLSGRLHRVRGVLQNGDTLNTGIWDFDGGLSVTGPNGSVTFAGTLAAPEPAPFALLLPCLLTLGVVKAFSRRASRGKRAFLLAEVGGASPAPRRPTWD